MPRNLRALALAAPLVAIALAGTLGAAALPRTQVPAFGVANRIGPKLLAAARRVRVPPKVAPAPPPCPPEPPLPVREPPPKSPIELVRAVKATPSLLGSASLGSPTRGSLWGGVELEESDGIATAGDHPWGTESVVRSIERAVRQVRRCFPGTQKLSVGDISRERGGGLKPHRSHQSGLDADIGYYYTTGPAWFKTATASNLDRRRVWALVRAMIDGGNVESIYIDRSVQSLLKEHAMTIDEDRARLDALFETEETRFTAFIHHAPGHGEHFHVRFRDPEAVALGARLRPLVGGPPPVPKTPPVKRAPRRARSR